MTWLSRSLQSAATPRRTIAGRTQSAWRRRRTLTVETMERRIVLSNVWASYSAGVLTIASNVNSSVPNGFSITETTAAAGGKVTIAATELATTINSTGSPYTTPGPVTAIRVSLKSPNTSVSETVSLVGAGKGVPTTVKSVAFDVARTNLTLNVGVGNVANGVDNTGAFTLTTTGGLNANIDNSSFASLTIDQSRGCCLGYVEFGADAIPGKVSVSLGNADGNGIVLSRGDKFGSTSLSQGNGAGDFIRITDASLKDLSVLQGDGAGDSIHVENVRLSRTSFGVQTVQGDGEGDTTIIRAVTALTPTSPTNPSWLASIDVTQGSGDGDSASVIDSAVASYISIKQGDGDQDNATIHNSSVNYEVGLIAFWGWISVEQGGGDGDLATIRDSTATDFVSIFQGDGDYVDATISNSTGAYGVTIYQGHGDGDSASILDAVAFDLDVVITQGDGDGDSASIVDAVSDNGVITINQGHGAGDFASIRDAASYYSITIFQGDGDGDLAMIHGATATYDVTIYQGHGGYDAALIIDAVSFGAWVAILQGDGDGDSASIRDVVAYSYDVYITQGDGDGDFASISQVTSGTNARITQGDGDGDYAEMVAVFLGSVDYVGPYAYEVEGNAVITQGDGYHDVAVIDGGSVVNNISITQGDNVFSPDYEPGLGDEVHINNTTVTSDVVIVQGTSDENTQGGYIATIGDMGDVTAGGQTHIHQYGGGNQVVLGGAGSSLETSYLDVWTGGVGGGFVTAQNTTIDWGSWFGLDYVVDGGGGGNTFYDAGGNDFIATSDNYNTV